MNARRASLMTALLLTAALLVSLPMLARSLPTDANRMDARLRPARTQTLTVWLCSEDIADRAFLGERIAAFEKEVSGVRVFLRRVPATDLFAENAVLPDVALYGIGTLSEPERVFLPLTMTDLPAYALAAGRYSGECYGVPLWYEPNVLAVPDALMPENKLATARPDSFFATPEPLHVADAPDLLSADQLPWRALLQAGAITPPEGVALQQLLFSCPATSRAELSAALGDAGTARVRTWREHRDAVKSGESEAAYPLSPLVSDRVRMLSLTRETEAALAFARFLLFSAPAAPAQGLLPAHAKVAMPDKLGDALQSLSEPVFPNAYAHTREELFALCADAFTRTLDPVETLLRLR